MATEKQTIKKKVYVALRDVAETDKCPPQAKLIMDTIKTAGGKIGRDELILLLKRPPDKGGLTTNQTAERILGFYRPKLEEMGVMKEEVETTEIEVQVPDKPEKTPKPEAVVAAGAEAGTPAPVPQATGPVPTKEAHGVKGTKGTPRVVV